MDIYRDLHLSSNHRFLYGIYTERYDDELVNKIDKICLETEKIFSFESSEDFSLDGNINFCGSFGYRVERSDDDFELGEVPESHDLRKNQNLEEGGLGAGEGRRATEVLKVVKFGENLHEFFHRQPREEQGLGRDEDWMVFGVKEEGGHLPELVVDNEFCLSYLNYMDVARNLLITKIRIFRLNSKKKIFEMKTEQKNRKGLKKISLRNFDVRILKDYAILTSKEGKGARMTMVINFMTRKIKRSGEVLNPEAFIPKNIVDERFSMFEHKTRFYRLLPPEEVDDLGTKAGYAEVKKYSMVRNEQQGGRRELLGLVYLKDSTMLYNYSQGEVVFWFPLLNFSQKPRYRGVSQLGVGAGASSGETGRGVDERGLGGELVPGVDFDARGRLFFEICVDKSYFSCWITKICVERSQAGQSYSGSSGGNNRGGRGKNLANLQISKLLVDIRSFSFATKRMDYEHFEIDLTPPNSDPEDLSLEDIVTLADLNISPEISKEGVLYLLTPEELLIIDVPKYTYTFYKPNYNMTKIDALIHSENNRDLVVILDDSNVSVLDLTDDFVKRYEDIGVVPYDKTLKDSVLVTGKFHPTISWVDSQGSIVQVKLGLLEGKFKMQEFRKNKPISDCSSLEVTRSPHVKEDRIHEEHWQARQRARRRRDVSARNLRMSASQNHMFYANRENYIVLNVAGDNPEAQNGKIGLRSNQRNLGSAALKAARIGPNSSTNSWGRGKDKMKVIQIFGRHEEEHKIRNLGNEAIRARISEEQLFLVDELVEGKIKTKIFNFDNSHLALDSAFYYNQMLYRPLSYHAVTSLFSYKVDFLDYTKFIKQMVNNYNTTAPKLKEKIETAIKIGEDLFPIVEGRLRFSEVICLLKDTDLLKRYLHTFYEGFKMTENKKYALRRFNLLKKFCEDYDLPAELCRVIDGVKRARWLEHQEALFECVEISEDDAEKRYKNEAQFKDFLKELKQKAKKAKRKDGGEAVSRRSKNSRRGAKKVQEEVTGKKNVKVEKVDAEKGADQGRKGVERGKGGGDGRKVNGDDSGLVGGKEVDEGDLRKRPKSILKKRKNRNFEVENENLRTGKDGEILTRTQEAILASKKKQEKEKSTKKQKEEKSISMKKSHKKETHQHEEDVEEDQEIYDDHLGQEELSQKKPENSVDSDFDSDEDYEDEMNLDLSHFQRVKVPLRNSNRAKKKKENKIKKRPENWKDPEQKTSNPIPITPQKTQSELKNQISSQDYPKIDEETNPAQAKEIDLKESQSNISTKDGSKQAGGDAQEDKEDDSIKTSIRKRAKSRARDIPGIEEALRSRKHANPFSKLIPVKKGGFDQIRAKEQKRVERQQKREQAKKKESGKVSEKAFPKLDKITKVEIGKDGKRKKINTFSKKRFFEAPETTIEQERAALRAAQRQKSRKSRNGRNGDRGKENQAGGGRGAQGGSQARKSRYSEPRNSKRGEKSKPTKRAKMREKSPEEVIVQNLDEIRESQKAYKVAMHEENREIRDREKNMKNVGVDLWRNSWMQTRFVYKRDEDVEKEFAGASASKNDGWNTVPNKRNLRSKNEQRRRSRLRRTFVGS